MDAKKASQPTWETVRYMISCIQYGGRITDDFDQLLMDTFAEKYFHAGTLQPNFEIYKDDRSGYSYRIPDTTEVNDFRAAIELLPAQESPEVYGLHPNADLTFRTLQVRRRQGAACVYATASAYRLSSLTPVHCDTAAAAAVMVACTLRFHGRDAACYAAPGDDKPGRLVPVMLLCCQADSHMCPLPLPQVQEGVSTILDTLPKGGGGGGGQSREEAVYATCEANLPKVSR